MKKTILVIMAVALVIAVVPAKAEFAKVGTVGLKFLDIGVGGRALAMGEAFQPLQTTPHQCSGIRQV